MNFIEINAALGSRIGDLLIALQIDLINSGDYYIGCCPVHGGDNIGAFRLNGCEHEYPLSWTCWSHDCASHWGRNLIGLTRGILSHQNHFWSAPGDDEIEWCNFFDWINNFLDNTTPTHTITRKENTYIEKIMWNQWEYTKKFSIPSKYYMGRNFSEKILVDYLVADCHEYGQFYKRAIIPILKGSNVIGITSRSTLPECSKCKLYHHGKCPDNSIRGYPSYQRWAHQNFKKKFHLYNWDRSLDWTRREKTCILVESPGSVWRLEEAGIPGSLATLGCMVSEKQLEMLAQNNIQKIIMLFDGDSAGIEGARRISEKYSKEFQFIFPSCNFDKGKDLADYSPKSVARSLHKKLKGIYPL